jgi:hypothetical protein
MRNVPLALRSVTALPRLPRCGMPGGGVRPGWSSSDGGSEEFPEFRDAARSSRSTHPASPAFAASTSATRAASTAFCAASSVMSCPCSAISASRAASSGLAVTDHHHPVIPPVIKPARWAGRQETAPARRPAVTARTGDRASRSYRGTRSAEFPGVRAVPG